MYEENQIWNDWNDHLARKIEIPKVIGVYSIDAELKTLLINH